MSLRKLVFIVSLIAILFSCHKEYSYELITKVTDNTKVLTGYGWTFDGNGDNYHGCVNSASKTTVNGLTALVINGVDSANNDFTLTVGNLGNVKPGLYNIGQGATMSLMDKDGNVYSFNAARPGSFAIKVVTINDTLFVASFAGILIKSDGTDTMKIENGAVKTLIGKTGTCMYDDNGGNTPPDPNKAAFDFTPTSCDNKVIGGTLTALTPVTSANTIKFDVNVTKVGTWNISFPAKNGIAYSGSGTFTQTGVQSITLTATGTPIVATQLRLTLTINNSDCEILLTINTAPDEPVPASPTCTTTKGTLSLGGKSYTMSKALSGMANPTVAAYQYTATSGSAFPSMLLAFGGSASAPVAGVYKLVNGSGTIPGAGQASIMFYNSETAGFTAVSGYVFVTVSGGKRVLTFCDATFTDGTSLMKGNGQFSE